MQTCPALRNFEAAIVFAATSMFASSNTITGAWPPSSIVARFMYLPASDARCLPTTVEPVNEILRITGWGIRYSLISAGLPYTRLTTPGGTPASANARMSSDGEAGVSSGALTMIEQPVVTAAESFRTIWLIGKFHGVNAATGPTGSLITRL